MVTDWVLFRRLAHELQERLRGARVEGAGRLADGRVALDVRRGRERLQLSVDAFASPPLVTLATDPLPLQDEPGFVRALAGSLRGTALADVRSRRGDRLLRLRFTARSRFGVGDEVELYLELVPRFGNLVLVKRDRVVAAAKEFSLAENGRRAVAAGLAYQLPPLPGDAPSVPRLLAAADATALLERALSEQALREPLYVYREGGRLRQVHLVPLPGYDDAAASREPSLLALLAELREDDEGRVRREHATRRRRAALKRLDERERKLREELAALHVRRREAGERDALRAQGEATFAELHALEGRQREDAKARAAKLFARYKKLGASLSHVERREREMRSKLDANEALRWEAERVADGELDDLEEALAAFDSRGSEPKTAPARRRKRAPLHFFTETGSRISVGRSPLENAELTFKQARPNDLWFHARGIPGAHVILARDDRSAPPEGDVAAAAALAAFHSKARASAKVAVDYALRKYVRKQRDAAPGLVWYTNARTIVVPPRDGLPSEAGGTAVAETQTTG